MMNNDRCVEVIDISRDWTKYTHPPIVGITLDTRDVCSNSVIRLEHYS